MKVKKREFIFFAENFAALILLQILFIIFTTGIKDSEYWFWEVLVIALMSSSSAAMMTFLRIFLPDRGGKIAYGIAMGFTAAMFAAQEVYYALFGTFFTVYSMINSAQVTEFMDVILINIWNEKLPLLLIIAVGAATIARQNRKKVFSKNICYKSKKIPSAIMAAICLLSFLGSLIIGIPENSNPKSIHQNIYGIGEIRESVESLGLIGAMEIDCLKLVIGYEPSVEAEADYCSTDNRDNVIGNLDFQKLEKEETDSTIKTMHRYFGSRQPTEKNDKTGIFKGKNLIFITAESFTDFAIDKKYTPTLYKLKTEGFNFTDFYNPLWGVSTIDGEYVNLLGLIPKPGVWSMKESSKNYLPLTLAHSMSDIGYDAKAYHNHSVYYYQRDKSHPNLGYDFKGQGREYSFKETWPESDLEMIDKTTSDFLTPDENGEIKPFSVYYLTVSGHLEYNFYDDDMAIKNREVVEDMPLSDACKAYMAANIELDKAIELLIERLKEAGELDNTVIALAGDHYPYGLDASEISEFRGHETDEEYELYKSTFLLWTPDMEPETVDKLSSNMDILPTLCNMFGIEYDSRLLMGKDIFSESEGFVVFKDKDWISERGSRKSLEGKDDEYVAAADKKVADMFAYSALVIDRDYYYYLKPYL